MAEGLITGELLLSLGAFRDESYQQTKVYDPLTRSYKVMTTPVMRYVFRTHGIETKLQQHPDGFYWLLEGVPGGHHVTHVCEIFSFLYLDGFEDGKEEKQKQIKEVLGIE